ncbi:RICIN domain-containing protein [Actinoplanes sp. NPDC000266]
MPASADDSDVDAFMSRDRVELFNYHSLLWAVVKGASTANLAPAVQWRYEHNAVSNDIMVNEYESGNYVRIKPAHTFSDDGNPHNDMCLAVKGAAYNDEAVVVQATCTYDDVNNDVWVWTRVPGFTTPDWVTLKNLRSGKCLVVKGGSKEQGAPLIQFTCNGSDNSIWRVY